jgi:cytochrome P450
VEHVVARRVPELDAHPILGHAPVFHRHRLEFLDACAATPGPVARLRMGRPALLLKRAEDVQHVLVARHADYPKGTRNVGARARQIFGTGLLTAGAGDHRGMRVRAQPAFRRDPVGRLEPGIVRRVDAMIDRWSDGGEVNLADEMNDLALRTLTGAILGDGFDASAETIRGGIDARRRSMGRAFTSPLTQPGFLPVSLRREERRAIRGLDETLHSAIRARVHGASEGEDLLSMLIARTRAAGDEVSVRRIRGETLNLVLASHSNVARALTYTLAGIARRPLVAEALRTEVEEVIGDDDPTAPDRGRLRYLEMTLAESMRLWPPSAFVFRVARADDVLPSGTPVRAGWKILVSPYVVQRDPTYWPDPLRFDPERFAEGARRGRPKYSYFPFGGGPRFCIGQTLSTSICTLALARVTQRVGLELAAGSPAYACGCLPPGYGPRMRVAARVPAATGT